MAPAPDLGTGRDLVDGPPRLVPGVADGIAFHVPAPGDSRGDTHVYARTDHADPFDRLVSMAVDPNASRYEGIEGHQVVDDQANLLVSGSEQRRAARQRKGSQRGRSAVI